MKLSDQMTSSAHYATIPRTLVFLRHANLLLLLRGDPHKPLWANKLNGVGGHVEPDEDPWRAAQREVLEETGFQVSDLQLRALVHVSGSATKHGVMLFVFLAHAPSAEACSSHEGELSWYTLDALPWDEMVEDLPLLLPHILSPERASPITFGLYTPGQDARLGFSFRRSP
jgi:8-oxo-dGTP diphosphatase